MKILLSGGGTMGSVSPLLAIKEVMQSEHEHEFLFVGSEKGIEKSIVSKEGLAYRSIPTGKLRRYFDWRNFVDPLLIIAGFFKSIWIIWRFKPDIILTAGSFVCVPVVWAGALLKKKCIVHQQDLRIGLANKLMVPFAYKITVAFDELYDKFPKEKVELTGNPCRQSLFNGSKSHAISKFGVQESVPTLLVMSGGIGSQVINETFIKASKQLTAFCQVIHVLGRGEQKKWLNHPFVLENPRYHAYEFLSSDLADAYAMADLVVSRGGLATLTELSVLKKPSIIIPIPKNQQEENANYFNNRKAIVYVQQADLEVDYIVTMIKDLFEKPSRLRQLSENIFVSMPQYATAEYIRLLKNWVIK